MLQWGHSSTAPHLRHCIDDEYPRRLMKRIVCSLRSNLACMASASGRESAVAPRWRATSMRMSTRVKDGRLR